MPGKGPWILYGGPQPFTQYGEADRPAQAVAMCARVAEADHSIILGSGNCFPLPDPLSVSITSIGLEKGSYVVNYETIGYTEQLPGRHIHFYFDTVPEAEAGVPGNGPWILYGGPRPFTQYGEADRPAQAAAMCARVAEADHSVIYGSGNCFPLPNSVSSTVTIQASKDNTLYSSAAHVAGADELSNAKGTAFFTGKGSKDFNINRRAVLAFDLTSIPSGAEITAVTLELNMLRTNAGDTPVTLHTLNKDWGEGTSDADDETRPCPGCGGGDGVQATPGDATWNYSKYSTDTWASPGGDFDAIVRASAVIGVQGKYSWSSSDMATNVQNWLDNPSSNHGWLLKGVEGGADAEVTAKVFASRENPDVALRPQLIVEYITVVP